MLDGLKLELAGVPTASIVTSPFVDTGRAMAKAWGVEKYRFLTTNHPIANLTDEKLLGQARALALQVARFFVKVPNGPLD